MRRISRCVMVLAIIAVGSSCGKKPAPRPFGATPQTQGRSMAESEYGDICAVISQFYVAVKAQDLKALRRVSPLVGFGVEEGVVDLQRMASRFAGQEERTQKGDPHPGKALRIVPGYGDALAFTGDPEVGTPALWYYLQQHDNGHWVVQFCEDWEVSSIPELFEECRSVVRKAATTQHIRTIETVLNTFVRDCGTPPSEKPGLSALLDDPGVEGWNGPYLHLEALIDPWRTAYQYQWVDGNMQISSAGKDRQPGTADDIHVSQRAKGRSDL